MKHKIPKNKRYIKTNTKTNNGIDISENTNVGVVTFCYGRKATITWSRTVLGRLFMEEVK